MIQTASRLADVAFVWFEETTAVEPLPGPSERDGSDPETWPFGL